MKIGNHKITITELKGSDKIPYALLLLADPSKSKIDEYISASRIFVLQSKGQEIGCYVLQESGVKEYEIKNIAVEKKYQGNGFGKLLLLDAIAKAKAKGCERLIIGTGNSSLSQLHLYQKIGFRITAVKTDFFSSYGETIIENGIECKDMIVLTKYF